MDAKGRLHYKSLNPGKTAEAEQSRKGTWDNAPTERFFRSLKQKIQRAVMRILLKLGLPLLIIFGAIISQ